jgi:hypothetical protein
MLDDLAPDNQRGQEILLRFGFVRDINPKHEFMVRLSKERFNSLYSF